MKIKHVGPRAIGTQPGDDGETFQAFGVSFDHGGEAEIPDRTPDAHDIATRVHGNPHFTLVTPPKGWKAPDDQDEMKDDTFGEDDDDADEREKVIAKLQDKGVAVDKRKSLPTLKGDLAKAEAEAKAKGGK